MIDNKPYTKIVTVLMYNNIKFNLNKIYFEENYKTILVKISIVSMNNMK